MTDRPGRGNVLRLFGGSGERHLPSGDTSKSFTFTATHDTVDDDDESVKLTFGTLPTGVSAGTVKETLVSITDDDDPQVEVNFRRAIHDVAEGADRTVTVKLTADPERTVVVPLTATDQDGATSADYAALPASVTFESWGDHQGRDLHRDPRRHRRRRRATSCWGSGPCPTG